MSDSEGPLRPHAAAEGAHAAAPPSFDWTRGRCAVGAAQKERGSELLLDNREHVAGREHQVLLTRVLDLRAAVLAVQHHVADLNVDGYAGALVVETTRANRDDLALLGLLLRGVRDHEPGRGNLLGLERLDDNAVLERLENNLGGGRHSLTSPSGKCLMGELLCEATRVGLPSRVPDLPRRISTLHE